MELLWQKKTHPKQIIISCRLEERGSVRTSKTNIVTKNRRRGEFFLCVFCINAEGVFSKYFTSFSLIQ